MLALKETCPFALPNTYSGMIHQILSYKEHHLHHNSYILVLELPDIKRRKIQGSAARDGKRILIGFQDSWSFFSSVYTRLVSELHATWSRTSHAWAHLQERKSSSRRLGGGIVFARLQCSLRVLNLLSAELCFLSNQSNLMCHKISYRFTVIHKQTFKLVVGFSGKIQDSVVPPAWFYIK